MKYKLNVLLAEIALIGTGNHCHEEANCIAEWLHLKGEEEAVQLIRLSSLMNRGDYASALQQGNKLAYPDLEPWLALCEYRLGLGSALESRLNRLARSQDPRIQTFVNGMREQLKT